VLATLAATEHPFLRTNAPDYTIDQQGNTKTTFTPVIGRVERLVGELNQGKEYIAIPDQFRDLPPGEVMDWTASQFGINPYSSGAKAKDTMREDPEAADGTAYVRLSADELPLPIGGWNNNKLDNPEYEKSKTEFLKQDQAGQYVSWPQICRTIAPADVPGPGYHWYRGPRFPLYPGSFVYATKSWQFQQHLTSLGAQTRPGEIWEAHLSVKFTGPAYPHGKADDANAAFIDRMILVRVRAPSQPSE
jgi:hypothetical protein